MPPLRQYFSRLQTLRLDDMSSAERHKLALDVALMVAAFVMFSAYL